ncbi:MAG: lysophospholipid acyltransferase family protein [Sorangiineae bacterium]|nr:lysophospholipid acyltransferase family protein [Polyangiaceae bacterium]MEB2322496.1 lysophospholipid acyltransferase family protein [Sorangiineae bacterium]
MDRRRALARLTDVAARDVIPLGQRFAAGLRRSADELTLRLVGPDFDDRVQQLRERYLVAGGDPFGLDPDTAKYAILVCAFFHRMWFRTEVHDIEHVPPGRVLLIANHSGQVPIDGAIIGSAMFLDAEPPRMIRAMVEKWALTLPFVGTFFNRVGQVVGVPENARRLLENDEMLLVFPEGTRGINKPFNRRYQLEEFGLGFMRLAIETGTPIVPVAVIGAEEQYVNLGNVEWLARTLGMPSFPVMPQLAVPGGQLPLPTKYRLYFAEPMRFDGDPDDDDAVLEEKVWLVKQTIQSMLNRGLKARKGIFF